ncbi:MAG: hypothetical protein K4571_14095 [Deltaproteobacteria bacterium]
MIARTIAGLDREAATDMAESGYSARTVTLNVRFDSFHTVSRACSLQHANIGRSIPEDGLCLSETGGTEPAGQADRHPRRQPGKTRLTRGCRYAEGRNLRRQQWMIVLSR